MSAPFRRAADVRTERIRWLIPGLAPLRGVTVVGGEAKLGKSLLTGAVWPAAVTRGLAGGEYAGTPRSVFVVSAEDDWPTVIAPRLMAAGADLELVHFPTDPLLELPRDVGLIEDAVAAIGDVGLVVIDPIGAFLGGEIDSHRDASVRHALAPLAELAMRTDVAVAVVCHLNKAEGARLVNRVVGSVAFVAAARSFVAFSRDPEDPDGERGTRRVIVPTAANWGPLATALAANVESRLVDLHDGSRESVGFLNVTGESEVAIEDLQGGSSDGATRDDVAAAILDALADGPRGPRDVKAAIAAELHVSWKSVQRAAEQLESAGHLERDMSRGPRFATWAAIVDVDLTPSTSTIEDTPPTLSESTLWTESESGHVHNDDDVDAEFARLGEKLGTDGGSAL